MPRILVVDDELLIRDLLYDFFTSRNYDIILAESASKALEILGAEEIDLVLTDLKMPDMDGLEMLKRANTKENGPPVIIMTGFPSLESAVEALRLRVADYIVKPFNINRLFECIEAVLEENAPVVQ
ncbi:MAG: response regulator [candidate division Zixibacteria bacterium]|nr:response regulator [candidate division Zixibacteria bacterium]